MTLAQNRSWAYSNFTYYLHTYMNNREGEKSLEEIAQAKKWSDKALERIVR